MKATTQDDVVVFLDHNFRPQPDTKAVDVEPDDETELYTAVIAYFSRLSPDAQAAFGELFGAACRMYRVHAEAIYGGGDALRENPYILTGVSDYFPLVFVFKADNNGNTYRVGVRRHFLVEHPRMLWHAAGLDTPRAHPRIPMKSLGDDRASLASPRDET